MNRNGIRTQLLQMVLIPMVLVIVFLSVYFGYSRISAVEINRIEHINNLAESIAHSSEFAVASGNRELLSDFSRPMWSLESVKQVRFYDNTNLLLDITTRASDDTPELSGPARYLRQFSGRPQLVSVNEYIIERTPLVSIDDESRLADREFEGIDTDDSSVVGKLLVTTDLTTLYATQIKWINTALIYAAIALIIATIVTYSLARSLSSKLENATQRLLGLASTETVYQPTTIRQREIDQLTGSLDFIEAELASFHQRLSEEVDASTKKLPITLQQLQEKNAELTIARRDADNSNQFKTRFLANVSHEIRTPLNAIVGSCEALTRGPADDNSKHLDRITSSVNDILYQVDQLID